MRKEDWSDLLAAGTAELPGRKVRQKSGLNRAILDQGWNEFRRQLEYKQEWRDGLLLAVPPQYTSQTCPACGHVAAENRRTQAAFECVGCGFAANADHVAAINILARGHRVLACGEMAPLGRSMKQEPAEVTERSILHGGLNIFGDYCGGRCFFEMSAKSLVFFLPAVCN